MRSHSKQAGNKPSLKEFCALALMGALMFAAKLALAALPNVHIGAVLIVLSAVFFGWRCMYSVAVYVML